MGGIADFPTHCCWVFCETICTLSGPDLRCLLFFSGLWRTNCGDFLACEQTAPPNQFPASFNRKATALEREVCTSDILSRALLWTKVVTRFECNLQNFDQTLVITSFATVMRHGESCTTTACGLDKLQRVCIGRGLQLFRKEGMGSWNGAAVRLGNKPTHSGGSKLLSGAVRSCDGWMQPTAFFWGCILALAYFSHRISWWIFISTLPTDLTAYVVLIYGSRSEVPLAHDVAGTSVSSA